MTRASLPRSAPAAAARPHSPGRTQPAPGHCVQFYEDDAYLEGAVADYAAEGLAARRAFVGIVTRARRDAVSRRLHAGGIDVDGACRDGLITWLDADETLARLMAGGPPDDSRLVQQVGPALDRCAPSDGSGGTRVFGEMVNMLWRGGEGGAALRLERAWNDVAAPRGVDLLCAYRLSGFGRDTHADGLHEICRLHARVLPAERYTLLGPDEQVIEVVRLQHRVHALEGERETLAERERAARAAADAASRTRSEFLASMSHELRTPLNAIAGYLQLIELGIYGPVTAAQHEALSRARRSQQHLLALINDLLHLTRIDAGLECAQDDVPLLPLLEEARTILRPLLAAGGVACVIARRTVDRARSRTAARADREKVQQILLNLIAGAFQFTSSGGRITVEAAGCDDGARVCVRVSSTGGGLAPERLEAVFAPFPGGRAIAGDGVLGLGLVISRDLARAMGGDLLAASAPGAGTTTFTLVLPAA